jgi:hypothetical protein
MEYNKRTGKTISESEIKISAKCINLLLFYDQVKSLFSQRGSFGIINNECDLSLVSLAVVLLVV